MKLEIRPVDLEKEYEVFAKWWEAHGWLPLSPVVLSNFGYVVCDSDSGRMLAAGWAYMDKYKPIAFIEWLVSNPENPARESVKALTVLIDGMTESFKRTGYLVAMVSTKTEGLIKLFKKKGYLETDSGLTHMAQILNQPSEG